ncbi:MAG: hypothetical protein JNL61_14835, partial [Rhizobiaceae bacterium]|nr:hypothetical protein [Rhizobiaceae bacterium]
MLDTSGDAPLRTLFWPAGWTGVRRIISAWILFFALLLPVSAADLPTLTGRVVDDAGLIDPATKAALVAKLAAFEKKSSDQI